MAESVSADSHLLRFYRGEAPDAAGRHIADIWAWDHRRLEMAHDYIQWLFPASEPSRFNPVAPLLTAADAAALRRNPDLRARLIRSFDLMLNFYGLAREGDIIRRGPTFPARSATWLTPTNHNYLRLTRILLCLRHADLDDLARGLLACLQDIAAGEGAGLIPDRTLGFWRGALIAPPIQSA
ncbi:MAG: hypothetical protein EPO08_17485 [Rhodospirillaceae bacterium]|nr:MAG: hypothetical protein EPO08_17485 [Rhodospirillaceae bacterium]